MCRSAAGRSGVSGERIQTLFENLGGDAFRIRHVCAVLDLAPELSEAAGMFKVHRHFLFEGGKRTIAAGGGLLFGHGLQTAYAARSEAPTARGAGG